MHMRVPGVLLGFALVVWQAAAATQPTAAAAQPAQPPFDEWLTGVRAEARTRGISDATLDAAFAGLEPLPIVVQRDRSQAEIVQTLDRYLTQRVTAKVVATARARRVDHAELLDRVAAKYGVAPGIIIAVWGIESNFGRFSGVRPTIQTLATLAYDPRRAALFREELFSALKILDSGDVEPAALRGSWAGALGQPQFMPSSFLLYAQDFDGDGRRNIWSSTPDVFASIANFLVAHGWNPDQTWGREVRVPASTLDGLSENAPLQTEGCLARRQMTVPLPIATWTKLGVVTKSGGPLPATDVAASLVSGTRRHFLVYPNYQAILEYNCVNAYGISVGLLADANAKDTKAPKDAKTKSTKTKGKQSGAAKGPQ
jgi:membrane-bound lytic murein transglycosylase B